MKTKVNNKDNNIFIILEQNFGKNLNLARIKFLGLFICSLCKVQTVCFERLSCAFDSNVNSTSSLRRIQRFMSSYKLNIDAVAQLIFSLLPHKAPYTLSIDRTNWKFGSTNINALVLAITYRGVAFPIVFKLLSKRGNSNTSERIELMKRYIKLFGYNTIKYLVADREFVGQEWIKWLNDNKIEYHIRIKGNYYIVNPRTNKRVKASHIFNNVKIGEFRVLDKIYYVNNQLCYLSASKIKDKKGALELQILISFCKPSIAHDIYRERWQIETAFRALKSSGFNIEDTHLKDLERIEKLFSLVLIAFTWSYKVGIYLDEKVKAIRIFKNGKRAKSIIKYGLEYISRVLLANCNRYKIKIYDFLSCT